MIAELRELANDLLGQTDDDADMDRTNNTIVVNERPHFETWEDVVRWARAKIVDQRNTMATARMVGLPGTRSSRRIGARTSPVCRSCAAEGQGSDGRANGDGRGVRGTATGGQRTGGTPPSPLDRPIATWSQGDVRIVINSPAHLRSQHPRHTEAQRMVRLWFEKEFGTSSAAVDATGRMVRGRPGRRPERVAKDGACQVPVRAHPRRRQGRGARALPYELGIGPAAGLRRKDCRVEMR